MAGVLVTLRSVGKRFGPENAGVAALCGVTAEIQSGAVTGLIGPDGAGKTTLMRLMAGLEATDGEIRVCGMDPIRYAAALRCLVGYMPQKFGLYEDLSVLENLELHADLRGVVGHDRRQTFDRLLRFTDLARFTTRLAGKLSGGMKQKLGLACALLGKPRILLLDEPSVGVDPISRRELWRMVKDLISEGMAVVWSTAYLDEAEQCSTVLLLNEGKLLFTGTPPDLTGRVAGRCYQTDGLVENKRTALTRMLRHPHVLDGVIQGRNVRLVLRSGADTGGVEAAAAAGLVPVPPRFEDAFMDLLGGGPGGESVLARHLRPVPAGQGPVIEAVNLTKRFGGFAATDNISFEVNQGEIYGLLGPNGAGKSTTFKMMCGLLTPTSGAARVMGIDLKRRGAAARQRLGYMAQKFSLYGNLSTEQNLRFFSGIYGLRGSRQHRAVDEMLEVFGLRVHSGDAADTLPLGFKQRLALACAVMHEPDILFLDEPTSGVDPVTRREFWNHINAVVEKGVTVMVTTHFLDEAEYCDRIGLVYRGKLIAAGSPDELKARAASPEGGDASMEEAFIRLVQMHDERQEPALSG